MTRRDWVGLVLLLALYWALAFSSWTDKSATYDEPLHLAGGYTYWKYNDYRIHLENGILPQRLAALPLLAMGLKADTPRDSPGWNKSDTMGVGRAFFNDPQNPSHGMLLAARAGMACVGSAVVALVFFWARRLWGSAGAWVAAAAAALCPTMLAHGPLCTSDMTATLFFLLTILLTWRVIHVATPTRVACAGLAIAGLVTSKFSWPLALVMVLWMMAIRLAAGRTMAVRWRGAKWTRIGSRMKQAGAMASLLVVWAVMTWSLVWAIFGFRESMLPPNARPGVTMRVDWPSIAKSEHASLRLLARMHDYKVLPEGYLWGAAWAVTSTQSRRSMLMGEYSTKGHLAFFPFLIATKTPPATFALVGMGIAAILVVASRDRARFARDRARLKRWYWLTPAAVLLVIYLASALTASLNIGHRHVLPIYPVLYVLAGASACWLTRDRLRAAGITVAAMLVLLAVETGWRYPNYLAYFNFTIGGPAQAHRYVVDSSVDWGQELINLQAWLDSRNVSRTGGPNASIAYFGMATPATYFVPGDNILSATENPEVPPLKPGYYCVSASLLEGVYTVGFGPWDVNRENEYQATLSQMRVYWASKTDPDAAEEFKKILTREGQAGWTKRLTAFRHLRFERLCAYLRHRTPTDNINASIFIYLLSDADLRDALEGKPAELVESAKKNGA